MAIFKIVGQMIHTIQVDGRRVERVETAYRLVRIKGRKPITVDPEAFKGGLRRSVDIMALQLGFVEGRYASSFVTNDDTSNTCMLLPSFSEYDQAVSIV